MELCKVSNAEKMRAKFIRGGKKLKIEKGLRKHFEIQLAVLTL